MTEYNEEMYNRLYEDATRLAYQVFYGVQDKVGKSYMFHCRTVSDGAYSVAKALNMDEESSMICKIVGMLHDVVEDSEYEPEHIEAHFGPVIANLVDNVSKRKGEPREQYFSRVFSNKLSMIVKFADSNHNGQLNRLADPSPHMVRKCAGYAKLNSILGEKLGLL